MDPRRALRPQAPGDYFCELLIRDCNEREEATDAGTCRADHAQMSR
jgi:hypothetical protein